MCVGVGEGGAGGVLRWCSLRSLPSPPPRIQRYRTCLHSNHRVRQQPPHFQPHRRTPSPKRCQAPSSTSSHPSLLPRAPEAEPLYVALHRLPCSENSRGKTKQISLSRVPLRGLDVSLTLKQPRRLGQPRRLEGPAPPLIVDDRRHGARRRSVRPTAEHASATYRTAPRRLIDGRWSTPRRLRASLAPPPPASLTRERRPRL